MAVRVLCQRRAQEEVKAQIRREGRVKLSTIPPREIVAMAEARLVDDEEYRAKLIADAKRVVEQWRVEGFFGKQAALSVRVGIAPTAVGVQSAAG